MLYFACGNSPFWQSKFSVQRNIVSFVYFHPSDLTQAKEQSFTQEQLVLSLFQKMVEHMGLEKRIFLQKLLAIKS